MADDVRLTGSEESDVATRQHIEVHVLGPLAVEANGREVHVAGSQRRRLLALLASRPGRMVHVDAIVDALWGEDPPPSAAKTVQSHVVRLRRSLSGIDGELIETVAGGYRLAVDALTVDAVRFEQLAADGRRELGRGAARAAVVTLSEALGLWRGAAYAEFADAEFATAAGVRLDELRLRALEDLAEAHLSSGTAASAIPDLERLVVEEPGRERAWALLMRALYAAGRQHHALVAFQRARRVLADSFGLDPGPELRALERRILDQDPELTVASDQRALPVALRTSTAMIGRVAELAWLGEAWEVARRGTGQVRVLLGPVDGGRTRLAAEIAAHVIADGGWVEYVRGVDGLESLVRSAPSSNHDGAALPPGAVIDAVTDRSRRGPLMVVVDDIEWMLPTGLPAVEALAGAAERLSLLLLLIADPVGGGPAIEALRRLPAAVAATLPALPDKELARVVTVDGIEADAIATTIAIAGGLPGVARREAAALAESAASDRLHAAAASSFGATAVADEARASVFDEVLALVAARARRDELVSTSWAGRQPFRALAAYGPEDADLFVGRERLVADLAARVLDRRLVAVVGASGSGKSSLVRAGLVPLVRSGRLPVTGPWRTNVIVPGRDPLAALESVGELDEPGPQLLVIDQFEEAIASESANVFADRLLDLVLDAALDIRIVLVVRADQYAALTAIRPLAEFVEDAQLLVGPPTDDELRRIIEVPAWRTGCVTEPSMIDLVVADVGGREGTLPLVSAALAEVWERRDGDTLTAERYLEIGGIAAAVERLGARAIERAGGEDGIHEVMMRLVDVTDDGQWVRRQLSADEIPPELGPAVDALVEARLARRDNGMVDVVHEIVFRTWPSLATWLEEARSDLVLDREMRAAARAWDSDGRSDDDVYRGARLEAATEFTARHSGLSATVMDFVAASRNVADRELARMGERLEREQRARRQLGRAFVVAAVLLVLALAGGGLALLNQRRADHARGRASDAAALAEQRQRDAEAAQLAAEDQRGAAQVARLIAESERELGSHLDLALLLAVEAHRREDSPEAKGALLTALTYNMTAGQNLPGEPSLYEGQQYRTNSSFVGFLAGPPRLQYDVDVSDDGRIVASGGHDESGTGGLALFFDTTTRREIGRVNAETTIDRVDVSADGRYVLAVERSGAVHLFRAESRTTTRLPIATPDRGRVSEALFRPDSDQLVTMTSAGQIAVWDRATMREVDIATPTAPDGIMQLTRDGTLVIVEPGPAVLYWDLDSGREIRRIELDQPWDQFVPEQVAFSPGGGLLVGAEASGLYMWDLVTGQSIGDPGLRPSRPRGLAFNPATPWILAVGSTAGGISLFDAEQDQAIGEPLFGHGSAPRDVAFSADGRYLVTIADDGLIGLWGPNVGSGPVAGVVDGAVASPSYSADGRRVAVGVALGEIEVRDGRRPERPGVRIRRPDGGAYLQDSGFELSADGSAVLAFTLDEIPIPFVADAATGEPIWTEVDTDFTAEYASLSPDGRLVAAVDDTFRRLRTWDVRTGERVADTTIAEVAPEIDAGVSGRPVFSADGRYLDVATNLGIARFHASDLRPVTFAAAAHVVQGQVHEVPGTTDAIGGGVGGQISRLDLATGELVVQGRSRDSSSLTNVAVSADGSMVAAYHPFSSRLALFDAATLRPIGRPFPVGNVWFAPQFSADGRFLAGNGLFNTMTRWRVDPESWQRSACRAAGRNLTSVEWAEYVGDNESYRPTCPQWATAG